MIFRNLHMGLSNGEFMKGFGSTKKMKISDEKKDYISDLPDSILVHILSFLPIRDAINTVLLRRFGNLWRNISVLDLNEHFYHHNCEFDDYNNEKFVGFIRNVLNLHKTVLLDKLLLKVDLDFCCLSTTTSGYKYYPKPEEGKREIDKLIGYGISRNVKVMNLSLRLEECLRTAYILPDIFRSNYLRELRLVACNVNYCRNICLKSLRVLSMQEIKLNDETMEKILHGCPFLEDLSLVNCNGLKMLYCQNPNLKKMMLTFYQQLTISCPYLLILDIAGFIERAVLLDVSAVVDVSISFSGNISCEQKAYVEVRKLLQRFRLCTTFTPCNWSIWVLARWNLKNVPCPSFSWKNLILKLCLTKWHHPGISLLLRSSISLETLTMYIYPPWDYGYLFQVSKWIQDRDFDGENYWDSLEATFPHLKSIMIYGYINEPYVMQMVKFLLRSTANLQKMVISTKGSFEPTHDTKMFIDAIKRQKHQFTSGQLLKLSNKLLTLPRASSKAVIYFS